MSNLNIREYKFGSSDIHYLKAFPIANLTEAFSVTLSIYGVVIQDDKILLQGDYTQYIHSGREGIRQPDGRFVWPFLSIKWIPESELKHQYLCFVYNRYDENNNFLGHRRCDSVFLLKR
jgi:hypothetical protein